MQAERISEKSTPTTVNQSLSGTLKTRFGAYDVHLTGRGAASIYSILKAIGQPGAKVAMPSNICASIPCAVIHAGYNPWFFDVNRRDFNLDIHSNSFIPWDISALIAPHIYGHPLDIESIIEFCQERGIVLIEDIAQASGEIINGRMLGTCGDLSIMSFHPSKLIPGRGGGAIVVNNPDLAFLDNLRIEVEQLPKCPYDFEIRSRELVEKINPLLNDAREDGHGVRKIEKLYLQNLDLIPYRNIVKEEHDNLSALDSLDSIIAERKERAEMYRETITCDCILHPELKHGSPLFRYSIVVDGKNGSRLRRRITNNLRENDIHASNLYYPAHRIFRWDNNNKLPVSEWISDRIINLWLDDSADDEYIFKTAEIIESTVKQ